MKTLAIFSLMAILILSMEPLIAQTYNWSHLSAKNKHFGTVNLGWEYGMIYGLGYSYQIKIKSLPVLTAMEYSFPSGKKVMDDFKAKMGCQVRWVKFHQFYISTKIYGVFRRFENNFVRLSNFGSDFSGTLGYYRTSWFVSGEVGFDKAIVTNFKHTDSYHEINPTAVSGWFNPSTGGNFYYGLQTGFSTRKSDINVRIGKILTQDFRTKPMIPYYLNIGYNIKFLGS